MITFSAFSRKRLYAASAQIMLAFRARGHLDWLDYFYAKGFDNGFHNLQDDRNQADAPFALASGLVRAGAERPSCCLNSRAAPARKS